MPIQNFAMLARLQMAPQLNCKWNLMIARSCVTPPNAKTWTYYPWNSLAEGDKNPQRTKGEHHRHLREVDHSQAQPPAFVDTSSYVASRHSHHKIHFGTVCGASILICPSAKPACQLWLMSSLFILDIYGEHQLSLRNTQTLETFLKRCRPILFDCWAQSD